MEALDTTVLVSALYASKPDHSASRKIVLSSRCSIYSHALTETFSTLTCGRLTLRLSASDTARLLREQIVPHLKVISLNEQDLLNAYDEARDRGIPGGAIYDYLHLFAARLAGAARLHTLNSKDFLEFHREGDPIIATP